MMPEKSNQSTYWSDNNSCSVYFQTLMGWTKPVRLHWRWSQFYKTFFGVFQFPAISPQLWTRGLTFSETEWLDAAPLWAGPRLQSLNHNCLKPFFCKKKHLFLSSQTLVWLWWYLTCMTHYLQQQAGQPLSFSKGQQPAPLNEEELVPLICFDLCQLWGLFPQAVRTHHRR